MQKTKMKDKIIEIKSLSFRYKKKDKLVLNNINLSIKKGEIFGLLGPNGAGKTTLIQILSTLLKPFIGFVMVNGVNLKKRPAQIRKLIGVMFQQTILDEELTGYQNLDFYAKLFNVSDIRKGIQKTSSLVELDKELDKKVKIYSGGMKRKLELARCFLIKPKILLLDEPTLGLDPFIKRKIWGYLKELNKKHKFTILLATPDTQEADYLCDRIGILDKGKLIVAGSPLDIKSSFECENLNLTDLFIKCIEEARK